MDPKSQSDKINLQKETCLIKGPKFTQTQLFKGEKMMSCLKDLLLVNMAKLSGLIGFGQIGRHLECLVLSKEPMKFHAKTDDQKDGESTADGQNKDKMLAKDDQEEQKSSPTTRSKSPAKDADKTCGSTENTDPATQCNEEVKEAADSKNRDAEVETQQSE